MTSPAWPELPAGWATDRGTVAKYRELLLAAQINLVKDGAAASPTKPTSPADDASEIKLHDTLSSLVVGSIDRARDGAKFVETAAAALGTVYTGILAFSFAASGTHLPARGVYAAIFLGLAIVGSSFYLAFIQRLDPIGRVQYRGSRPEDMWRRTEYLGAWTGAVVRTRAWALRAAVIALAWGVVFMPAAFLPARISTSAFSLDVNSSGAEAPVAAEPTWPPPPAISDPGLAAVLYKAQLDQFIKTFDAASAPAASTPGVSTDAAAFMIVAVAAISLVLVAAWDVLLGLWGRRPIRRTTPPRVLPD